ncbi:MAG TPA: site-specific integrase [Nitrososphaeraceae archaeon]
MELQKNIFAGQTAVTIITRKNGIPLTVRNNRMRFFFADEYMAFYDKLKPKQRITFHFLIQTGGRINECRHVKVSDIDFNRNSLIFRVTKSRNKDGSVRPRIIPISSQFVKYLKTYIVEHDLKTDDTFNILSTPAANIAMKKALQLAGIDDWKMFSVHNVRKTFETWLLALDIDSIKVIKHVGHSVGMAIQHYVSSDTFSYEDKQMIRSIIGDLYTPMKY